MASFVTKYVARIEITVVPNTQLCLMFSSKLLKMYHVQLPLRISSIILGIRFPSLKNDSFRTVHKYKNMKLTPFCEVVQHCLILKIILSIMCVHLFPEIIKFYTSAFIIVGCQIICFSAFLTKCLNKERKHGKGKDRIKQRTNKRKENRKSPK